MGASPYTIEAENSVRIDLMAESLNVGHDGRADTSFPKLGCLALQVQRADLKQSRAEGTALQRKVLGSRRVSVSPGSFRAGGAYPSSQPAAIAFPYRLSLPKTTSGPPRRLYSHQAACPGEPQGFNAKLSGLDEISEVDVQACAAESAEVRHLDGRHRGQPRREIAAKAGASDA